MSRRAWAVIDLGAVRHNLEKVRQHAPNAKVMAAIKANGYGHGAVEVSRALAGADALAVATIEEGLQLRTAGLTKPIVLLGGVLDADALLLAVEQGFHLVVHDFYQLALIEQQPVAHTLPVWLKLDTGMHRLGFAPAALPLLKQRLASLPQLRIQGWMTHFASADDSSSPVTSKQIEIFHSLLDGMAGARSLANSAGIIAWPASHADWVRPGIMLYGASPLIGQPAAKLGLKPAMTLHSRVLSIRELPAGEAVGYGGTWTTPERMRVAVVAIGYGDGYPRHVPSGTSVLIRGRRVPLVGRVSMDMITVDLRGCDDVREGDAVTLWGDGLPADEVAFAAGTIAYELFCGLGSRVGIEYRGLD